MGISYQLNVTGGTLSVQASGNDDGPEDVRRYGLAVIEQAVIHGVTRVLCDERALAYTLDTLDTFESAKFIAELAPKVAKVAIVCALRFEQDGRFWETVAVNRGMLVRIFTDYDLASAWIAEGTDSREGTHG